MRDKLEGSPLSKAFFKSQNAAPIWWWVSQQEVEQPFAAQQAWFATGQAPSITYKLLDQLVAIEDGLLLDRDARGLGTATKFYTRHEHELWVPLGQVCELMIAKTEEA